MEEGIAHLFLVAKNTSKLKAKIEKRIPKKKAFVQQHDKQTNRFFEMVTQAFVMHFKEMVPSLKAVIVGSPGFIKDSYLEYLKKEVVER